MTTVKRVYSIPARLVAALFVSAAPAAAQVPWEAPQLLGPHSPAGIGLHVADYGAVPGDGLGLLLAWREGSAPGVGFRVAVARGANEDPAVAGGIDFSAWLVRSSPTFPIDMVWTTGAGAGYGEYLQVAVPVGIAAGRVVASDRVWFSPYLSARVVFDGSWGEDAPDPAIDLGLASDIGADVSFDPGRRLVIRFAASLGDRNALILGAHTRFGS